MRLITKIAVTICAILFMGWSPAAAGREAVSVTFDTSTLRVDTVRQDGQLYSVIRLGDLYSSPEVGAPDLPVKYIKFVVPIYTNNFRVYVSPVGQQVQTQLSSLPWPVQTPQPMNGQTYPFTAANDTLYSLPPVYSAEVVDDSFVDGSTHIITVAVFPTKFSKSDMTLTTASQLDIKLDYDICDSSGLRNHPVFTPKGAVDANLESCVVNPSRFKAYVPGYGDVSQFRTAPRYYIVTPHSLENALGDLVAWKRQKGYTVIVKCVEDIINNPAYRIGTTHTFSSYSADGKFHDTHDEELVDSAASVRAYLKDEYISHGSYFCLLVGDSRTSMPIRRTAIVRNSSHEYYRLPTGSNYIPTDNYFSDFTTKWDLTKGSNETIYSCRTMEISYAHSIYNGRLLCNRPEEIANYFKKLRIYEENPGLGNTSYLKNILYFEHDGTPIPGKCSLVGETDKLRAVYNPFPETTTVISDLCFTENAQESKPHMGHDIINAMKKSGFSNWYGHGSPGSIGTCGWQYYIVSMTDYTLEQLHRTTREEWDYECGIDLLDNADSPSIAYAISCTISPFDNYAYFDKDTSKILVYDIPYNFGSSFTVAGEYGGPAILANTREGYLDCSDYLEVEFLKKLPNNPKLGVCENISKDNYKLRDNDLSDRIVIQAHHLIGEPEFEMWLDEPEHFSDINFSDNGLSVTSSHLDKAVIAMSDGYNECQMDTCKANKIILSKRIFSPDYMVSVWKRGYLPKMRVFALSGSISDVSKKYLTQTAVLGTGTDSSTYTVGQNAVLNIVASESIDANSGFIVEQGGEVVLECDKNVYLHGCIVKAGGKLTVKAKNVSMDSSFKVEAGGSFVVNNL